MATNIKSARTEVHLTDSTCPIWVAILCFAWALPAAAQPLSLNETIVQQLVKQAPDEDFETQKAWLALAQAYYEANYDGIIEITQTEEAQAWQGHPMGAYVPVVAGWAFLELGFRQEAYQAYNQAMQSIRMQGDSLRLLETIRTELAFWLVDERKFAEAVPLLYRWLHHHGTDSTVNHARVLHNLGTSYLHLARYDSAQWAYQQSRAMKEALHDTVGLATTTMDLANLHYVQYQDALAIPLFEEALGLALQTEDPALLKTAYFNMAVVEENRERPEAALDYRKKYERLLQQERNQLWMLAQQQKAYEVSLQQQRLALAEAQQREQRAELARQRTQRQALVGIAGLLLVIAAGTSFGFRKVQKANRTVSLQKESLAQLNQTKNRLFSILAHDLKTPMRSLQKSQTRLIAAAEQEAYGEVLAQMQQQKQVTDRTYQLLNNLLHWALEESDQLTQPATTISFHRLVSMVLYDCEGIMATKNLRYHWQYITESAISVDVNSLKVVLRNLLDNAIKFTAEGGTLTLSLEDLADRVRFTLTDTGTGIPERQLAALNAAAPYAAQADTTGLRSTGLGVDLARAIVARHEGTITWQSEGQQGTTVILELPTPTP